MNDGTASRQKRAGTAGMHYARVGAPMPPIYQWCILQDGDLPIAPDGTRRA